jgi:hypothetical protein
MNMTRRKKTQILFIVCIFLFQFLAFSSQTENASAASGLWDQSLKVQFSYTGTDKVRFNVVDQELVDIVPHNVYEDDNGNRVYVALATYNVYFGAFTQYGINDIFTSAQSLPYSVNWLHETVRKWAQNPTSDLFKNDYVFTYNAYSLGTYKATGFNGKVPVNFSIQSILPSQIDLSGISDIAEIESIQSNLLQSKVISSTTYYLGETNAYINTLNEQISYALTDVATTTSTEVTGDKYQDKNVYVKDQVVSKWDMKVEQLPIQNKTSYGAYSENILQGANVPHYGFIDGYLDVNISPQVTLINQPIRYDSCSELVVGTVGQTWWDTKAGISWDLSQTLSQDRLIPDRIIGWKARNKGQIVKTQETFAVISSAKIDKNKIGESADSLIATAEFDAIYWESFINGGGANRVVDSTNAFAEWWNQYWPFVIGIIAFIGIIILIALAMFKYSPADFALAADYVRIKKDNKDNKNNPKSK